MGGANAPPLMPEDGLVAFDGEEYPRRRQRLSKIAFAERLSWTFMDRQGGADCLRDGHLAFQGHLSFLHVTTSFIIPYFLNLALHLSCVKA